MSSLSIRSSMGAIASLLVVSGSQVLAQETVVVPVDVTITVPPPPQTQTIVPTTSINTTTNLAISLPPTLVFPSFAAEVCGGLGDPLETGINRFQELTEQRQQVTSEAERERLDRQIVLQGLRLPDLITADLNARTDFSREQPDCEELAANLVNLMEQVADYLGALQDAKTAVLW